MTDDRGQMTENRNSPPFVFCHLFSVLCPLYPVGRNCRRVENLSGNGGCSFGFYAGLPEDKWRGVVVNADMLFSAAGWLKILFDFGATATCQQTRQGIKDQTIQHPQKLQHDIKKAHTESHLQEGRLGRRPQAERTPRFCQPIYGYIHLMNLPCMLFRYRRPETMSRQHSIV